MVVKCVVDAADEERSQLKARMPRTSNLLCL